MVQIPPSVLALAKQFPREPMMVAAFLMRISFGFSLLFIGASHYAIIDSFVIGVADGFDPVPPLYFLATVWGYILPALQVFGGALFIIGRFRLLATWSVGLALFSIPAGMLFKTIFGLDLNDMMASANVTWLWGIVFIFALQWWGASEAKTAGK